MLRTALPGGAPRLVACACGASNEVYRKRPLGHAENDLVMTADGEDINVIVIKFINEAMVAR